MFSIHRIELFPFDWLYLSPWESVVYAKRLELSYLDPLFPFFFGQQLGGDIDNLALGGDVAVTIAPFARVYVSLFIDEISFVPLSTFFTRPNNQYAWQVGVKVPLPWPAWSLFVFQYTKIEPYTYTHYLQTVPQYTTPIDISYTNDGENIGYHLPPNSDEFLVRLSAHPAPRLSAMAQYQLIRHGTGLLSLGQIEGDINKPIDYSLSYPRKDFLHDGIYEWIHIARLDLSYSFPADYPVTIQGPVQSWGATWTLKSLPPASVRPVGRTALGFSFFCAGEGRLEMRNPTRGFPLIPFYPLRLRP